MPQSSYAPPKRREPGLFGKSLSGFIQLIVWLLVSLVISIFIEWGGIRWFWPEQGAQHAKSVLITDQQYLNQHVRQQSSRLKQTMADYTEQAASWLGQQQWMHKLRQGRSQLEQDNRYLSSMQVWVNNLYRKYRSYIEVSTYVTQTFVIRLTLILFSLPVFLIAALVGCIDGLTERDLRRWGGGRESSNVFNLAKRSAIPAFIAACVIYISLPVSINPAVIILPFAVLFGLAVRIAFERLKKYF